MSKGAQTRRRLLDVAVRRFAAEGYRRTSVSEIAREAGLTPAAAYAYFPSKEALFKAAVDDDAAALIERARPEASPFESWLIMPARLQGLLPEHPLARRVLGAQEPEVIPQLLDLPALADLRTRLAGDLAAGQEAGTVRADIDPVAMALGLETMVLSLLMASVHVPVDEARGAGVLAVISAATSPPAS